MTALGIIIILIGVTIIFIGMMMYLLKSFIKDKIEKENDPTYNERVIKYAEITVKLAFASGMLAGQKNPDKGIVSAYEEFKQEHLKE